MHLIVSWDIKTEEPAWGRVNATLVEALKPYSWVRPLTTFYVVPVTSEFDRLTLRDRLVKAAQAAAPTTVHIVISPAMSGGQYDGYLPKDYWQEIGKRSV